MTPNLALSLGSVLASASPLPLPPALKLAGTGLRWAGNVSTISGNNFKVADYAIGMPDVVAEEVWFFFPTFYMTTAEELDTTAAYTIEGIATRASGGLRTRGLVDDGTAPVVVDPAVTATQYGRWVKFTPASPIAPGVTQVFTFAYEIEDGTVPQPRTVQANATQTNIFGQAMPVERWQGGTTSFLSTLSGSTTYNNTNGPRPPLPSLILVRGIETAYLGLGDSIDYGSAQATNTALWTNRMAFGHLELAMDDNIQSARIPGNNLAIPGWNMTATDTVGSHANVTASMRQLWAIEKAMELNGGRPIADMIVCGHGQNSVNSGEAVLLAGARAIRSIWSAAIGNSDIPLYWTGMPADTQSSDGFQTVVNQTPRATADIYPTGARWLFNAAMEDGGALRTDGTIQAHAPLWPISSADSTTNRDKFAVRPFSTTLAASYSGTGPMSLTDAPTPGAWLNFIDGTTVYAGAQATAVTGTGPFSVSIAIPGSPAISAGAIVQERWIDGSTNGTVGTITQNGVHPSALAHVLYSQALIDLKIAEGFTTPIVAPALFGVSISGIPQNGQTLTANYTVIGNPVPTVTFQWQRNGTNISGQTAQTITLNASTMGLVNGDTVSCEIVATNSEGTANAEPSVTFVSVTDGFVGINVVFDGTNTTTATPIAAPVGTSTGDLMLAFGATTSTALFTAPSGWTRDRTATSCTFLSRPSYDGTTPIAFDLDVAAQRSLSLMAYRDYDLDVVGSFTTTAADDPVAPGITVTENDSIIIAVVGGQSASTEWTAPAGWTRRLGHVSTRSQAVFERDAKAPAGALSGVTFTRSSGSGTARAALIALKPRP